MNELLISWSPNKEGATWPLLYNVCSGLIRQMAHFRHPPTFGSKY